MVAAESGEARASRLRALAAERQAEADKYAEMANAVEKGNHGERVVADLLDVLDGAGWCVLHDRYKPGSRANLDHIVVGPPGVFVIDAKNWKSAPLRFDGRGMSLRGYRKDEELRAAADCAQVVLQRATTSEAAVPAFGVLAFVQDMSLQAPVEHHGVWILQSEQLLAWLTSRGAALDRATVQRVGATLDAALPPRAGRAKPFTIGEISPPTPTPWLPSSSAPVPAPARRGTPRPRRSRTPRHGARRTRETFGELMIKLVALFVFLLFVVPAILGSLAEGLTNATPTPASSPAPALSPPMGPPPG